MIHICKEMHLHAPSPSSVGLNREAFARAMQVSRGVRKDNEGLKVKIRRSPYSEFSLYLSLHIGGRHTRLLRA